MILFPLANGNQSALCKPKHNPMGSMGPWRRIPGYSRVSSRGRTHSRSVYLMAMVHNLILFKVRSTARCALSHLLRTTVQSSNTAVDIGMEKVMHGSSLREATSRKQRNVLLWKQPNLPHLPKMISVQSLSTYV